RPVPEPARRRGLRAVRAQAGVPPLARAPPGAPRGGDGGRDGEGARRVLMPDGAALLLLLVVAVVALAGFALWRVAGRLRSLEGGRSQPDQSVLLLQREIETARGEARQAQSETLGIVRQAQSETLGTVRQELQQFSA